MDMQRDDLYFDGPGRYLILIKEKLSQDIYKMFPVKDAQDDLVNQDEHGNHLIIDIKDQSELMGLLNTLYDHHCTIIKVEYLSKVPG
ncbi:MAG: hypothetical protein PVH48_10680 [Cyclobacteriaceae bacterium]|jgi:hypothetical protein